MRLRPRFPGTMLVALLLACVVWYGTALERRERVSEKQIDASVTLVNVPSQMVITSEVPRFLTVRVRGPLRRLRTLDASDTGVVIDLRGAGEGEHEFPVDSRDVNVPDGVQVIAISPAEVPLRLERLVRRSVAVKARVVGDPAEGYEIGAVTVNPTSVLVSGPRLQLESLQSVTTDPVLVDGAEGNVESVVAVRSPLPLARIEEPLAVRVIVAVNPVKAEQKRGRQR